MGFREVTVFEIREVLRLTLRGRSKSEVAQQVGADRKTVRRYLLAAVAQGFDAHGSEEQITEALISALALALHAPPERDHGETWALCVQHRERIETLLARRTKLSKVRRLLARDGISIPYPTLHRFAVAQLSFGRAAPTMPVADCEPGEELQVDTGWVAWLEPDGQHARRHVRAWIFTSVHSRHRFVWTILRETTESAIEACEQAWRFFGGVFAALIVDNTKAIVAHADPLTPKIVDAFLEYAQARGFAIDTARVRHPKDKARVERSVPTVRDDCFGGERFETIEQQRTHAEHWCRHEYGMRRHTRTQRMPFEHFTADERPVLRTAPSEPYEVPLWCSPKVPRDQHVQIAKALYSVPTRLIGQRLRARADRVLVRIYDGAVLIKTHPRKLPGERSTDQADFPSERSAYAMRDVAWLQRQADEHGVSIGRFARALLDTPLPWTRMRLVYALLGLAKRFGNERVEQQCGIAIEQQMFDFRRLERMVLLGASAAPQQLAFPNNVVPISRYLRPASQFSLRRPKPTNEET
jgi:transposase